MAESASGHDAPRRAPVGSCIVAALATRAHGPEVDRHAEDRRRRPASPVRDRRGCAGPARGRGRPGGDGQRRPERACARALEAAGRGRAAPRLPGPHRGATALRPRAVRRGPGGLPRAHAAPRADHPHPRARRLPGGDARLREPPRLPRHRERLRPPAPRPALPGRPRRGRALRQRQGLGHLPARLDLDGEAGVPRPRLRPAGAGGALALLRPRARALAGGDRHAGAHPLRPPVPADRPPLRALRALGRDPRGGLPAHPEGRRPRAAGGGRQLGGRHPGRLPRRRRAAPRGRRRPPAT